MQSYFQYRLSRERIRSQLQTSGDLRPPHMATGETNSTTLEKSSPMAEDNDDEPIRVVDFDDNDDLNPRNWSFNQRCWTTLFVLSTGVVGGWASANEATILPQAQQDFEVSNVTESLSTGLYLIAFGVGSLFCGPFSETVGRNPVYLVTLLLFIVFVMACALAPNIGSQLVFRSFAGLLGCTAVTTFAGSVADLWTPKERALVFTLSSAVNFCGAFLAPCVGAFIGQSNTLSWRWVEWITLLMSAVAFMAITLLAKETYAPVILSWKAQHLRSLTGDQSYRSDHELRLESLWVRLRRSVHRPFDMFFKEITVVLFTVYLTVLYIVTFSFVTVFPLIYQDIYGFSQGSMGLSFLSLDVGILVGAAIGVPLQWKYASDLVSAQARGETNLPPESRLVYVMVTAPFLPVGLFLMAWTSRVSVSYWVSLVGSAFVGVSFLGIFVGTYLYLIDSFESLAASALAIATICRYVAAGAMIPVSIPMYKNLGVPWALTMLGCISVLLTLVPFVFHRYGGRLRKRRTGEGGGSSEIT